MKLNRLHAPQLQEISEISLPPFEKLKLDNGIPLWLINTGSQELVKLQIAIPAGLIHQNKLLTAFFTNKLLKEGSEHFSAAEIAQKIDFYGAYLDSRTSRDQAFINVYCLNKHLDSVLQIIADILTKPSMPQGELQTIIEQEKQGYLVRTQKVNFIAQRKFYHDLFGEKHPYGKSGNIKDYEQVQVEDLQKFFKENYQVKDWHLFISGKVDNQTLEILNKHFGSLDNTGEKTEKLLIDIPHKIDCTPHFIEHKGAMQTALKMGKLTLNRSHKDYPILSLTQTILGGFFGSRLMQNIREDKGYTYGIHSGVSHFQEASVFSISSEIGQEFAEKALEEVYKEIKLLRTEKVKEEELHLVKNYMTGRLLKSLNGPFALGEIMGMLHDFNLPHDYFSDYISKIQATTSDDILRIAHQYLHEDDMLSIMVGSH